jgi:hypothetical protein
VGGDHITVSLSIDQPYHAYCTFPINTQAREWWSLKHALKYEELAGRGECRDFKTRIKLLPIISASMLHASSFQKTKLST